jgi:hypothetical protein
MRRNRNPHPRMLKLGDRAHFEFKHRLEPTDHRLYPFWSRCWLCEVPIYIRKPNDCNFTFHYESDEHKQIEEGLLRRNKNRMDRLHELE